MTNGYAIDDTSEIFSPGLVVFRDLVEQNLDKMIGIAKSAARLRPHCKTHKMAAVTKLELARGIVKHKAATFAEAEMLAAAGAEDVFLAYNPVGPNVGRCVRFARAFPRVRFSVTADHSAPLAALGEAMNAAGLTVEVLLDLDSGLHRTGLPPGDEALAMYRRLAETAGIVPGGLHVYDGHNHQTDPAERKEAVLRGWGMAAEFRDRLVSSGFSVPRIVAGGTGSFPIFAEIDDPALELSPGTCVFNDDGYGRKFRDLDFQPAAVILTRVISRPTPARVTCDLGHKACAADPPAGKRLFFPDLPDAQEVLQNEEHLVLETPRAGEFSPGDELIAIPKHICPTSALHQEAWVVSGGRVVDRWPVTARDRRLTI